MSEAEAIGAVPPDLVAGKYRLTKLLGRGGMGSVWEGLHTSLGTRVAVKFIESDYTATEEALSRFRNEAVAAAQLRSKHVVQVYDHGVMPDGRPYIVMEFLSGEPLDARLDRLGYLIPADAVRIIRQVCRALAKAHEVGIVHRDLKPENIFLVWDEEDRADIVKVVDFGIAKFTNSSLGVSSATRTGSVLGTPYYMSPEQARGLRAIDHRSDLWALGVIAFRCLTGTLPFTGEAIGDLLVKVCTQDPPAPTSYNPQLPAEFDAWFFKAVARDPASRFSSATELAETLAAVFGVIRAQSSAEDARQAPPAPVGARGSLADSTGATPWTPAGPAQTGAAFTHTAAGQKKSKGPVVLGIAVAGLLLGAVGVGVLALGGPDPEPTVGSGSARVDSSDVTVGEVSPKPPLVEPAPPDTSAIVQQPSPPTDAPRAIGSLPESPGGTGAQGQAKTEKHPTSPGAVRPVAVRPPNPGVPSRPVDPRPPALPPPEAKPPSPPSPNTRPPEPRPNTAGGKKPIDVGY